MDELNQIKADFKSYNAVVEEVGISVIEDRFNKLYNVIKDFISGEFATDSVVINRRILLIAVMDFFADISRLKSFHHIDEVNEYKMKAYESAWLSRRKPIQVFETSNEVLAQKCDYINEQFVFSYLQSYLMNGRDLIDKSNFKNVSGFLDSLFYYLKFRDCEPRALELMIVAFKTGEEINKIAIKKKKETVIAT